MAQRRRRTAEAPDVPPAYVQHMDAEQFRKLGHSLVDWIADYRETVAARPVMSRCGPARSRRGCRVRRPSAVARPASCSRGSTRMCSPASRTGTTRLLRVLPVDHELASILGDLACAGLGAQGMSWQTSPAATEIEEVVMDWLRQMVGLSPAWTGVIHDTASTATLSALICARERLTIRDWSLS